MNVCDTPGDECEKRLQLFSIYPRLTRHRKPSVRDNIGHHFLFDNFDLGTSDATGRGPSLHTACTLHDSRIWTDNSKTVLFLHDLGLVFRVANYAHALVQVCSMGIATEFRLFANSTCLKRALN